MLGGLPAVALPGGDLAARQPWRNLLAQCLAFVPDWQDYPQTGTLRQRNWPLLAQAIDRGINAPRASSCGRLFDAVACALDCAPESLSYEGEAACRLEALAASCPGAQPPGYAAVARRRAGLSHLLATMAGLAGHPGAESLGLP